MFDDLLFCEERIIEKSYNEGFEEGASQGNADGYHLGYHRGAEFGAEVGYYSGVVGTYLHHLENKPDTSERTLKTLKHLSELIEKFPAINKEDVDIIQQMNEIRVNFKKLCAQLKTNLAYPEIDTLSF